MRQSQRGHSEVIVTTPCANTRGSKSDYKKEGPKNRRWRVEISQGQEDSPTSQNDKWEQVAWISYGRICATPCEG
jgi:hypothetical protein